MRLINHLSTKCQQNEFIRNIVHIVFPYHTVQCLLLTRGFIASTQAFNLLTGSFNLPTRAFNLPTRTFSLLTRAFELITRRFELATLVLLFHVKS